MLEIRRMSTSSLPDKEDEYKKLMDEFWESISPIEECADGEMEAYILSHASDELLNELAEIERITEIERTEAIRID